MSRFPPISRTEILREKPFKFKVLQVVYWCLKGVTLPADSGTLRHQLEMPFYCRYR